MSNVDPHVSGAALWIAVAVALGGWGVFSVQAFRCIPGGFRWTMIGSMTAAMVVAVVVGISSAPGWVGAGGYGAFLAGLVLGTSGRVDLMVDEEYLPSPPPGQTHPPRRQLRGLAFGTVLLTAFALPYYPILFPEG